MFAQMSESGSVSLGCSKQMLWNFDGFSQPRASLYDWQCQGVIGMRAGRL